MGFEVTPFLARLIIEQLGSTGTPPAWGVHLYSAGLEDYLEVIEEEYLEGFLAMGGSTFKLVVGVYGGGKTHFLYSTRDRAWQHGYLVSLTTLKPEETPFHDRFRIFRAVLDNLAPPGLTPQEVVSGRGVGLRGFLEREFRRRQEEIQEEKGEAMAARLAAQTLEEAAQQAELMSFTKVMRVAAQALYEEDDRELDAVIAYLRGEGFDRSFWRERGVLQKLRSADAFPALRSLVHMLVALDYKGLILLFDEAEVVPSLTGKQRDRLLSNLREVIDECGNLGFRHTGIFYAVPDEGFLHGKTGVYEALRQRLATVFGVATPSGVRIQLDEVWEDEQAALEAVGEKLSELFANAYGEAPDGADELIPTMAKAARRRRFGALSYRRLFVQGLVQGLQTLHRGQVEQVDSGWVNDILDRLSG